MKTAKNIIKDIITYFQCIQCPPHVGTRKIEFRRSLIISLMRSNYHAVQNHEHPQPMMFYGILCLLQTHHKH